MADLQWDTIPTLVSDTDMDDSDDEDEDEDDEDQTDQDMESVIQIHVIHDGVKPSWTQNSG